MQRLYVPTRETAQIPKLAASPMPLMIDINRATAEEFDQLPGIGEVKAAAIVAYRNQNGPFATVDELLLVDGISEALLAEIRPFLMIAP